MRGGGHGLKLDAIGLYLHEVGPLITGNLGTGWDWNKCLEGMEIGLRPRKSDIVFMRHTCLLSTLDFFFH